MMGCCIHYSYSLFILLKDDLMKRQSTHPYRLFQYFWVTKSSLLSFFLLQVPCHGIQLSRWVSQQTSPVLIFASPSLKSTALVCRVLIFVVQFILLDSHDIRNEITTAILQVINNRKVVCHQLNYTSICWYCTCDFELSDLWLIIIHQCMIAAQQFIISTWSVAVTSICLSACF